MGRYIKQILSKLTELNAEKITHEITHDESIFFKSTIQNLNVYLELYFEGDIPIELIINIYKKGEHILSFGGDIDKTLKRLQSEIKEH
jgi:hypothetical protein